MHWLSILILFCGCGRESVRPPLVFRWPPSDPALRREWVGAVVRWRVDVSGRRLEGRGALPTELRWDGEGPGRARAELWLADGKRPETELPTLAGEGPADTPVPLRLLDRRWGLATERR